MQAPVQRVGAGGGLPVARLPEGWLIEGACDALPGKALWPLIEAALLREPQRQCLAGRSLRLDRAAVHRSVRALTALLPAGGRIGVTLARSPASVIAALAIWSGGGAYVPLAPELPPARRDAMAEAAGLCAVLSDSDAVIGGFQLAGRTDCAGAVLFLHSRAMRRETAAPCVIAHTSGSSGSPKGVMIGETALINRLAAMASFLEVSEADVILHKTPALFDVHVWEFALPLLCGAALVIYEQDGPYDIFAIAELLAERHVTIAGFTPGLLSTLLRRPAFVARSRLRALLCGGEAWSPALARRVYDTLPGIRLYNSYGPTETTIAVTSWLVPDDPALSAIELGAPPPNTLFLVQGDDAPAADGSVRGRLLVGGLPVADGYVGGGGASRFSTLWVNGRRRRFFDTGDVVVLSTVTGALRFAGRQDAQVKVNGVRIDLDDVEEAVAAVPGVAGCAVLALPVSAGVRLCAVIEGAPGWRPGRAALLAGCAARLPEPYIPRLFRTVASLPLTPGGKVDRARLQAWIIADDERAAEVDAMPPLAQEAAA